jgi:hypothetical protein
MDRLMGLTQAGIPVIGDQDMVLISVETAVLGEALVSVEAVVIGAVLVPEWAGAVVAAEALVLSGGALGSEEALAETIITIGRSTLGNRKK